VQGVFFPEHSVKHRPTTRRDLSLVPAAVSVARFIRSNTSSIFLFSGTIRRYEFEIPAGSRSPITARGLKRIGEV